MGIPITRTIWSYKLPCPSRYILLHSLNNTVDQKIRLRNTKLTIAFSSASPQHLHPPPPPSVSFSVHETTKSTIRGVSFAQADSGKLLILSRIYEEIYNVGRVPLSVDILMQRR